MSCSNCETELKALRKQLEIERRITEDLQIIMRGLIEMEAAKPRLMAARGFPFFYPPHVPWQ